jgi:hypothetical protein
MLVGQTMSDWIPLLKKENLEGIMDSLETSRLEDDERLLNSGLPVCKRIAIPYEKFSQKNKELIRFLSKYQSFVVRALPIPGKNLPRRPKIGLKSFQECSDFLANLFDQGKELHGKEKDYIISVVEHEPTIGSGIIISNPEKTLIEISDHSLAELSHGQVNDAVHGVFTFHNNNHFRSMRYSTEDIKKREFMWRALQYIRINPKSNGLTNSDIFPEITFWAGYFEFVRTETDRIIFWDYKIKEGYLKI